VDPRFEPVWNPEAERFYDKVTGRFLPFDKAVEYMRWKPGGAYDYLGHFVPRWVFTPRDAMWRGGIAVNYDWKVSLLLTDPTVTPVADNQQIVLHCWFYTPDGNMHHVKGAFGLGVTPSEADIRAKLHDIMPTGIGLKTGEEIPEAQHPTIYGLYYQIGEAVPRAV